MYDFESDDIIALCTPFMTQLPFSPSDLLAEVHRVRDRGVERYIEEADVDRLRMAIVGAQRA
jgi:hypothetical protein